MNGFYNRNRTLGELMTELRVRCSQMTSGNAATLSDPLMKSFLREAHHIVYGALDAPESTYRTTIKTEAGEFLYDWQDDANGQEIDPTRVNSIAVYRDGVLMGTLRRGIGLLDREESASRSQPERYDHCNGQLEVRPIPDQPYDMVIEHTTGLARFDKLSDRPSAPDTLVFAYALVIAKMHYQQPDAGVAQESFKALMNMHKVKEKRGMRFIQSTSDCEGTKTVRRLSDGQYIF